MDEYFNLNIDETVKKTDTSRDGLKDEQVKERIQKYGYNKLKDTKKKGFFLKFLEQFKDVMLIILIISAILSAIVSIKTGETFTDTIIILIVVFLNAILGVLQESKAEKAIDALKQMSLPYIKVRRNGIVSSVKTEELVIGDIVLLEAGDYVPADMRIIESHSLRVEESALTGESLPVDKITDKIESKEVSLADRINMLYSGSNVAYGRGEAIVVATGMDTELGKIAKSLSNQESEITPLQKKINELSKVLSVIVVVITLIMIIVGYLKGNPIIDVFMLAISLAVAAIPEGLSAVITITLAIGVQKMAKEKAIVRKLSSVEALGATEVICSDKTGTLTQNKMTLRKLFINNNVVDVSTISNSKDLSNELNCNEFDKLIKVSLYCNDTRYSEENGQIVTIGDPTETALVDFARKIGIDKEELESKNKRIDEIPFDSLRKMMTTVNKVDNKYFVSTKGAVESILDNCDKIIKNGKVEKITDDDIKNILRSNLEMANEALRVLGCAYNEFSNEPKKSDLEKSMVFVGLVAMIDPPRKEAKKAVERCFNAGMIPIMITGDNIDTARAIAKELGIIRGKQEAITGKDIDKMSDEELIRRVENIRVYARVSPENKIRIVKAWKKKGKTVAMTGDGVNDAPALKGADIGIGMGITGTEVSKSVSSMVLADDNFATIVVAIKEGRRIYNNIQNVIAYLLASNLAEILIVFFSTLFNFTILLPIQILWINLITDTIPAIALGFEKEEKNIMRQKPRSASQKLFTPFLISRIVIPGILKTIVVFSTYFIINSKFGHDAAMGTAFILLSTIEVLFAFICRSDRKSVFKIGLFSNKHMLLCVIGTLILQNIIVFTPTLASLLSIPKLSMNIHLSVVVISIITVTLFEIIKLLLAKLFIKEK